MEPEVAKVRRVLKAAMFEQDEGLIGIVRRCAYDNWLPSTSILLRDAVAATHPWTNLATRKDVDLERLAATMRLPTSEVHIRMHPQRTLSQFLTVCRFFGTDLRATDLALRTRRFSPAALEEHEHHRALWHVALIPYCTDTGELLVEECGRCSTSLEWAGAKRLTHCSKCRRSIPVAETVRIDDPTLRDLAGLTGLIDPRPAFRAKARGNLPPDLQDVESGAVFDLAWSMGRHLSGRDVGERKADRTLSSDAKIDILKAGAEIIAAWPEALPRAMRNALAADAQRGARAQEALRRMVDPRYAWPDQKQLLTRAYPSLVGPRRDALRTLHGNASDGDASRRRLKICADLLPALAAVGSLETVTERRGTYFVADYAAESLERVASLRQDCIAMESIAERFGISFHGVEQIVRLGFIREHDDPAIPVMYQRRQASRREYVALSAELARRASECLNEELTPLKRAMTMIGGREKPWGPLVTELASGRLPFTLVPAQGAESRPTPLLDRALVRTIDLPLIQAIKFDCKPAAGSGYQKEMSRRDAESLLNLNPKSFTAAVRTDFRHAVLPNGRMDRAKVSRIARTVISGREVSARFLQGSMRMPSDMRDGRVPRAGALGWKRRETEEFFARYGHPITMV